MAGLSSIQQPRTHLEQSNEASPEPSLCQAKTPVFSRVPCLTGFPNGMVLRKWTPVGPGIDHSLSRWVLGSTEEQRTLASPSQPSWAPVPSHLHFSYPLTHPHFLPGCLGIPPILLGVKVPHQSLVGALVVIQTPCPLTPPRSVFCFKVYFI